MTEEVKEIISEHHAHDRKAWFADLTPTERLLVGCVLALAVTLIAYMGWDSARSATQNSKIDAVHNQIGDIKTLGDQGRGAICLQLKLQGADPLPAMCSVPSIAQWWNPNTRATTAGQEKLNQYHQMLCDLEADKGRHPPYCEGG